MSERIPFILCILIAGLVVVSCNKTVRGKQYGDKHTIDSLAKIYLNRLDQLVPNHKFEEAQKTLDTLSAVADRYSSVQLQFEYLKAKGFVWNSRGVSDSALYYYQQAAKLIPMLDSTAKNTNRLDLSIAGVFKSQGKWSAAFDKYKAVHDFKQQNGDTDMAMVAYNLGITANAMGNSELSGKYLLEAFRYPAKPMVKTAIASAIEHYYWDAGNIDSAKYYFNNYILADTTLSSALWLASKEETKGLFLTADGDDNGALQQYLKALAIQVRVNGTGLSKTYFNAANSYFKKAAYSRAIVYADSAIMASQKQHASSLTTDVNMEAQALLLKAKALQKTGNFREAANNTLRFYEQYMQYTDSSYAVKAKALEQQYDSKAKDQQITSLAKEKEAAQKINRQQKIIIAGAVVILLLLFVSGIVYHRRSRLKGKLQQTELSQRLLHSQLEPHFIFNTLGILQSFIRSNQTEKATRYLSSFAGLLRSNLENSRKSYILLEDELAGLESYLKLQSMRTGSNFEYELYYPEEEAAAIYVYPMMLQPFVENALQHGFPGIDYKGKLSITISKKEDYIECVIDDNGTGLTDSREHRPKRSSLAIQIIKERLALLSRQTKSKYQLELTDKKAAGLGEGTRVLIRMPYVYKG